MLDRDAAGSTSSRHQRLPASLCFVYLSLASCSYGYARTSSPFLPSFPGRQRKPFPSPTTTPQNPTQSRTQGLFRSSPPSARFPDRVIHRGAAARGSCPVLPLHSPARRRHSSRLGIPKVSLSLPCAIPFARLPSSSSCCYCLFVGARTGRARTVACGWHRLKRHSIQELDGPAVGSDRVVSDEFIGFEGLIRLSGSFVGFLLVHSSCLDCSLWASPCWRGG
jgi:hypothetical protein